MNNLNRALSGWDQNATLPHYRFSVVGVTPKMVEMERLKLKVWRMLELVSV